MSKLFKIIREILCVLGIIFLTKCAYQQYQKHKQTQAMTKKDQIAPVIKKTANAVTDALSDGLIELGTMTQCAKFKTVSTQAGLTAQSSTSHEEQLDNLRTLVQLGKRSLEQETELEEHAKNQLVARFKELHSQIEHLDRQLKKGPPTESSLFGPARQSAQVIHTRTIERKLLTLAQKTELVLADLYNETTGQTLQAESSETVASAIEHGKELLNLFKS